MLIGAVVDAACTIHVFGSVCCKIKIALWHHPEKKHCLPRGCRFWEKNGRDDERLFFFFSPKSPLHGFPPQLALRLACPPACNRKIPQRYVRRERYGARTVAKTRLQMRACTTIFSLVLCTCFLKVSTKKTQRSEGGGVRSFGGATKEGGGSPLLGAARGVMVVNF